MSSFYDTMLRRNRIVNRLTAHLSAWANLATAPIGVDLEDCPPVLL